MIESPPESRLSFLPPHHPHKTTMASLTPALTAKAKEFLVTVKPLTAEDDGAVSMETLYGVFLRLEILQRGMLVGTMEDDIQALLEAVQSVAGKALLTADSVTLPKPLVAGVAGMQGKVAELVAIRLSQDADASSTLRHILTKAVLAPVIQRCRDVEDERLLCIITLWNEEHAAVDMAAAWWALAEGCYYRATQFTPDAPPLWKRAWETHKARYSNDADKVWEPRGTIPALQSLHRLMQAKGNTKRATELAVRLASAWLDEAVKKDSTTCALIAKIDQHFVTPFQSHPTVTPTQALNHAQACLDNITALDSLATDDVFLSHVLRLQLMLWQNKIELAMATREAKDLAQKRSTSAAEKPTQAKHYQRRFPHSAPEYPTAQTVVQLCFLQDDAISTALLASSWMALTDFLAYQLDMLVALPSKDNSQIMREASTRLADFLSMIIARYQQRGDAMDSSAFWSDKLPAEMALLEKLSHTVCQLAWMSLPFHLDADSVLSFSENDFAFVHTVSTSLCKDQQAEALKAKTAAVSSQAHAEEVHYTRLRVARFASQCWMVLYQEKVAVDDVLQITRELLALANLGDSFVQVDASYGASFLGSMLAWSGFFHTPWEFSIVSEARSIIQKTRAVKKLAASQFTRASHPLEDILLDVAEADLESNGLTDRALKLYSTVVESTASTRTNKFSSIVLARCYLGLARLSPLSLEPSRADHCSKSLDILQSLTDQRVPLLIWKSASALEAAVKSQIVYSKQLIAENLVSTGRLKEAGEFLHSSVEDAPMDEVASFALGAFLLRMVFFHGDSSPESQKKAQMQLLKAAKLNPNLAGPFALLGYWYESKSDLKRAIGCYSKALMLEPYHPVAGRGMIRLADDESNKKVLEKAIDSVSSLNGWAWHRIGRVKAQESADELAVSALLKAKRSRDIEDPFSEPLSTFYSGPSAPSNPSHIDLIESLQDLASCYRRLGRCSAELRTLQSALEISGNSPSWSLLHACGQAELEMGLMEDAKDKFEKAILKSSGAKSQTSSFGKGLAAFMMARRDLQDGKTGVALSHLNDAIAACIPLAPNSSSISKLVGDMHSFLAAFPSELFWDQKESAEDDMLKSHIEEISHGEQFYSSSLRSVERIVPQEDSVDLRANLLCDKGVNILLRAQLSADWKKKSGHDGTTDPEVIRLFEDAQACFTQSLDISPVHAPAWCGLGCSCVGEPLKAQHAFSRAIELDTASPDPYANLGFLYLERDALSQGAEVCDLLTQVADTPMTWINRAYQIEAGVPDVGEIEGQEAYVEQMSDAYRASLQMQKEPFALLGLAASFRLMAAAGGPTHASVWENSILIQEHKSLTSLSHPDAVSLKLEPSQGDDCCLDTIAETKRAILFRPDYGDAWLTLSKQLLLGLSDELNEDNSMPARVAAKRANQLLLGKLTDPSISASKTFNSTAANVSDALAIDSLLDSQNQPSRRKRAQLALLICPQNALARAVFE